LETDKADEMYAASTYESYLEIVFTNWERTIKTCWKFL